MSMALRFRILERDDFRCRYCGRNGDDVVLEVDHIVPRSQGGATAWENLITACQNCNRGKRDTLLTPEHIYQFKRRIMAPIPEPSFRYSAEESEYSTCRGCGNRIYWEGDSFCSCQRVEYCDCGEEVDEDCDGCCRHCWDSLYVWCWTCAENEQPRDSHYCERCQGVTV